MPRLPDSDVEAWRQILRASIQWSEKDANPSGEVFVYHARPGVAWGYLLGGGIACAIILFPSIFIPWNHPTYGPVVWGFTALGLVVFAICGLAAIHAHRRALALGPGGFMRRGLGGYTYTPWNEVTGIKDLVVTKTTKAYVAFIPLGEVGRQSWRAIQVEIKGKEPVRIDFPKYQLTNLPSLTTLFHGMWTQFRDMGIPPAPSYASLQAAPSRNVRPIETYDLLDEGFYIHFVASMPDLDVSSLRFEVRKKTLTVQARTLLGNSAFSQDITLPCKVAASPLKIDYHNGIVEVTFLKKD